MDNIWIQAIGNLGRDVERQYTNSGKMVANASMAVETGWGDRKNDMWLKLIVWGEEPSKRFMDFCQKGTRAFVSGSLSQESWTKDGETKTQLVLTVKDFRVLSKGKSREEQEENPYDKEE